MHVPVSAVCDAVVPGRDERQQLVRGREVRELRDLDDPVTIGR